MKEVEILKEEIFELKSENIEMSERFEEIRRKILIRAERNSVTVVPDCAEVGEEVSTEKSPPKQKFKCHYCKYVGKFFTFLKKYLAKKHSTSPCPDQSVIPNNFMADPRFEICLRLTRRDPSNPGLILNQLECSPCFLQN